MAQCSHERLVIATLAVTTRVQRALARL